MFLKLTNAVPDHKGAMIAIRKDIILSVREGAVMRENGVPEIVTLLFCPPHGTWEVTESLDQVLKMLHGEDTVKPKKKVKVELLNEDSK